jgi:uncharacterized iron-regulated protein
MPNRFRVPGRTALLVLALALGGCAGPAPRLDTLLPADVVLLGERHDDRAHQRAHRDVIQALAGRRQLAAVALEMAEQGTSTAGLPRDAEASTVQAALRWNDAGWPWDAYGPAVMAAVKAGVPVLGANLPQAQLRAAMADASLDTLLDAPALAAQREAIRTGHCDLLPAAQLGPMVRVQLARDRTMARTLAAAAVPGQTVVLLAGAGHVDPALGVPRHLPATLATRAVVLAPTPGHGDRDADCAALRRQLGAREFR